MQFSTVLKRIGFFVFGYLLLLSLSYGASVYQPIVTLLVGLSIWFSGKGISRFHKRYGATKTFLGILLIGCAIRFLWAVFVPTLPISDFQIFYENATKLSQGIPVSSQYMGYHLLLAGGIRLHPAIFTGKAINAAASAVSILVVYLTGSRLVDQRTGLIASFLFAILPSEINMVSVLGTEVIATTLGLLTALFLSRITLNDPNASTIQPFWAGLFYGLGITTRFSLIFYLPAVLLFIFFIAFRNIKRTINISFIFFVGITAGLGIIVVSYSFIVGHISLEPLKPQNTIIVFLMGTNADTSGTWNMDDNNLYHSWPARERQRLVLQEALKRITGKPVEFLLLIPRKFSVLMASNDYGNVWSLYAIDWGKGNFWGVHAPPGERTLEKYANLRDKVISTNGLLSQAVYVFVWFFAFYAFKTFNQFEHGSFSENTGTNAIALIVLTLVLFTLLPHIILEVQSRYHHVVMPFITLLAACGVQQKLARADTN